MDFNHTPTPVREANPNQPKNTEHGAVRRLCEQHRTSRPVFYKLHPQAREPGPVRATEPDPRRPHHNPSRTDPAVLKPGPAAPT